MSKFRRLLNDVRKGEHIDLVLTVAVILVAFLLDLLGIAPPGLIASLTLVVLGLMAISSLGSRYQVSELREKLDQNLSSMFSDNYPPDLDRNVEKAQELWLIGVSLSRTVKNYYSVIENKLRSGYPVKAILTHPEGAALELSIMPVYGNKSLEQRKSEILGSLETFCELQRRYPDLMQVRTCRHYIGHGIIAVDPNSNKGKLYVENHPFKMPGGSRPKFVLEAKDSTWYDFYRQEMFTIWENCADWTCKDAR